MDAQFVDEAGEPMGSVADASHIPHGAFGVIVSARTDWQPFLLGIIGVTDWSASSSATAYTPGRSVGGGVMPLGIQDEVFDTHARCPMTDVDDCIDSLTTGHLNIPGGFGWLKFGIQGQGGKCDWASSLGMLADGGCESSKTFLDSQIGPPTDSHGCCTAVGLPGSEDKIGSLTGNEWGDLSFYIDNQIPFWVPIWDYAGRHRRERLVPHRGLRGHRPHRRQRARQVARGLDHRVSMQQRPGQLQGPGAPVLRCPGRLLHDRRHGHGPAGPLARAAGCPRGSHLTRSGHRR